MKITLGSRGSMLALTQAKQVARNLTNLQPNLQIDIKIIKTTGDKILDSPLSRIGDKGVFVKEIETALQKEEIDLAVHSVKDLPSIIPEDLILAAIPEREDPGDVLVTKENILWEDLPRKAAIGTSALRRQSQILYHRPDLTIRMLRGNVDTRLRKLDEGLYFGIVLARAGLNRLGIKRGKTIPLEFLLPSPGQGAIAVETRKKDKEILQLVEKLNDEKTSICVLAERSFLAKMEGGCQVPLGAFATISGSKIMMEGFVGSPDGKVMIREKSPAEGIEKAKELGERLANMLLEKGGDKIVQSLYSKREPESFVEEP